METSQLIKEELIGLGKTPPNGNNGRISLPFRTEFGYRRTKCDCELCSCWCRIMPGFLVPSDLEQLCPSGDDLMAWAKEHLRASQGYVHFDMATGEVVQVPSLVPAKQVNGHCHWLQADGRCGVHDASPFGCAFLDQHMSDREARRRNKAGRLARAQDFASNGPYSQVWYMLMEAGLIGGGEYVEASAELRRIRSRIEKRKANDARKERRKKKKQSRR